MIHCRGLWDGRWLICARRELWVNIYIYKYIHSSFAESRRVVALTINVSLGDTGPRSRVRWSGSLEKRKIISKQKFATFGLRKNFGKLIFAYTKFSIIFLEVNGQVIMCCCREVFRVRQYESEISGSNIEPDTEVRSRSKFTSSSILDSDEYWFRDSRSKVCSNLSLSKFSWHSSSKIANEIINLVIRFNFKFDLGRNLSGVIKFETNLESLEASGLEKCEINGLTVIKWGLRGTIKKLGTFCFFSFSRERWKRESEKQACTFNLTLRSI